MLILLIWVTWRTPIVAPCLVAITAVNAVRMNTREKGATVLRLKLFKAQNNMMAHADGVARTYNLVRDSLIRVDETSRMATLAGEVNYFKNAVTAHTLDSQLFVPTCTTFLVGAIICTAPLLTHWMGFTIGLYLGTISATKDFGAEAERLFGALIQVQLSVSALLKVGHAMQQHRPSAPSPPRSNAGGPALPTPASVAAICRHKVRLGARSQLSLASS